MTTEEKERALLRKLRTEALKQPRFLPETAWLVLHAESAKNNPEKGGASQTIKSAAERYKSLTPAEMEVRHDSLSSMLYFTDKCTQHYNHIANGNKAKNEVAYKEWVESHTPEQIRIANSARRNLKRRLQKSGKTTTHGLSLIHDERLARAPAGQYILFTKERYNTGDFKHLKLVDAVKLIADEWKALSASERQVSIISGTRLAKRTVANRECCFRDIRTWKRPTVQDMRKSMLTCMAIRYQKGRRRQRRPRSSVASRSRPRTCSVELRHCSIPSSRF